MPTFDNLVSRSRLLLGAALCLSSSAALATENEAPPAAPAEVAANAGVVEAADPVVMTIDGEPVSSREYRLVMQRHAATIFGRFYRDKKLEDHAGYWSPDTGPEGPLAKLRELVAAELVQIKIRQILGRQYGLVSDITFEAFLKQHEAENARRANALQTGQVIYGPQHYRLSAYYYTRLRDLEFRLKQIMAREFAGRVSDAEIERYFAEKEAAFGKKPLAEVRFGIIDVLSKQKAGKHVDRLCAEAKVEADAAQLAGIVPRSEPPVAPTAAPASEAPAAPAEPVAAATP